MRYGYRDIHSGVLSPPLGCSQWAAIAATSLWKSFKAHSPARKPARNKRQKLEAVFRYALQVSPASHCTLSLRLLAT